MISEDADPRLEETLSGDGADRDDRGNADRSQDPLMRIAQKLEHATSTPRRHSLSPPKDDPLIDDGLPFHYGRLFPIAVRYEKGGQPKDWSSAVDSDTARFIEANLAHRIVGVVDRMLLKMLKNGDFAAGKPLLYK